MIQLNPEAAKDRINKNIYGHLRKIWVVVFMADFMWVRTTK
jgi:hypothetical protein